MTQVNVIKASKPLVYSCSGCSNVAQLANTLALRLTALNLAEMSCISGVGGMVRPLVKIAKSGREIIALDGCPLNCVKACLQQHKIKPTYHFELTSLMGLKKRPDEKCTELELERTLSAICNRLELAATDLE
jgi:uncharacterized metal-binding protein